MSDPKGYYKLLDLTKDSSDKDIKKKYRKMALRYHPDKNPNDTQAEETFKKIAEAYQVLSDKHTRAEYDNISVHTPFTFSQTNTFDPFAIFKQFESQNGMGHMNMTFNMPQTSLRSSTTKQFSTNFSCSTQTIFKDGKKYVTITETRNGNTTKNTMIFDSKTNKRLH